MLICPQCQNETNKAIYRLVCDSCGHKKCRMCLLQDEDNCKQCLLEQSKTTIAASKVIIYENSADVNNKINIERIPQNLSEEVPPLRSFSYSNNIALQEGCIKLEPCIEHETKSKFDNVSKDFVENVKKHDNNIPSHIELSSKNPILYTCRLCQKQFKTKHEVKFHRHCNGIDVNLEPNLATSIEDGPINITTTPTIKKTYKCNFCEKTFAKTTKLNIHKKSHSSDRPFICSKCGKNFKTKEALRIHCFIHKDEKPYACEKCDAKFSHISNLQKHFLKHSQDKPHMCDQCGKRFKYKWALTCHRRSHLKIRPFDCGVCSRAFFNKKELQRHKLIHVESRMYICGLCQTGFKRKDNLHRHIKSTHPGKKVEIIIKEVTIKKEVKTEIVENPNAVNVITSPIKIPPAVLIKEMELPKREAINVPLKLAFKTSAFKRNYNINRDFQYADFTNTFDLAESVNICQKILTPHPSSSDPKPIDTTMNNNISTEICQKILTPSYSTSGENQLNQSAATVDFERRPHVIQNIKFKIPEKYCKSYKSDDVIKGFIPVKSIITETRVETAVNNNLLENESSKNYADLQNIVISGATSVIVNNLNPSVNHSDSLHWRRRMSKSVDLDNV